jgi:6-phosphogluconolactonase (cycloisomerase 2 family)
MECVYTTAISEDNTSVTTKTEYFNSTEEYIQRTTSFGLSTVRYSQLNKDITSNKFFQYDSKFRLTGIIQSDGTTVNISEYDAKNRYTKGTVNLSGGVCQVPFTNSYDDANLSFKQTISFSQITPTTNLICAYFSTLIPDQIIELFFDKSFFLTKKNITSGSTITTETYTTTESSQLCTGNDGKPYSAPIIQKFNSTGAAVGETASLTGINFDTDPGANTIQFANGIKTFASSATSSSLSFIVPAGAASSQLTITNRYGTATSKSTFYVYKYFIYAGNFGSNSISSLEISLSDGSLINPITSVFGNQPGSIIANPNGKYAYIINQGILAVNSVSVNPSSGALTSMSSANAGNGAISATIAFSGNLLFVLNQTDNTISRFFIDPTSGAIVNLGSAVATGVTTPYTIVAHPSLPFLYVTGSGSSQVSAFNIDASNGNLNPISGSPFTMSANPLGSTIHPTGLFLYTANNSPTNSISRFSINQLTGALSGETFYGSIIMESVAVDPLGKFLYACSISNNQINSYQINQANGTLTSTGSVASNQCRTVIVDPSGKYVYATEDVGASGGKINKFIIQTNGSLTSNGSLNLNTNNPRGLTIAKSPQ